MSNIELKQIYNKNNLQDLWEVDLIKWREIKIKTQENKWKSFHVHNLQKLKEKLLELQPAEVYYSLNCYNYCYRKRIFKTNFIIDIDEINEKEVKKAIEIMPDYDYIGFSGGGFQIRYSIPKLNQQKAKSLAINLKNKGIDFDYNISLVPHKGRVVRYLTTYNSKREEWSHHVPIQSVLGGTEELKGNETKNKVNLMNRGEALSPPTIPIIYNYMINKYKKSYVFYHKFDNLDKAKVMEKVGKLMNLEPLYYIQMEDDNIAVLSTKIISKERLLKAYKKIGLRKSSCLRFLRTSIMIKEVDGNIIPINPPKSLYRTGEERKDNFSCYHNYYLDMIGFKIDGLKKEPYIWAK